MKKVKGIELMKMIKSGEIKDDTRIKVIYGFSNPIYIFRNYCLYDKNNKEMGVSVLLSEKDFEILEDKIEEIEEIEVDRNNFVHTELGSFKGRKMDIAFANKINELARAVNSLGGKDE
jgi:hypothetical protein